MARAVCKVCGNEQTWYGGRGCKLADVRCNHCGGEMRAPTARRSPDPFVWCEAWMPDHFGQRGSVIYALRRVQVRCRTGAVVLGGYSRRYRDTGEICGGWRKLLYERCVPTCISRGAVCFDHYAYVREEDWPRIEATAAGCTDRALAPAA